MHKKVSLLLALLLTLGVFLGTSKTASAQDDPPSRVARLNFAEGSISYQPGGDEDQEWIAADRNRPLTTGDNLWSDQGSRGEVHIGSTAIRLSSQTGISFLNLDDNTIQIQLTQGMIEIHIRQYNPDNAYEIDTPNLAFTIYAAGKYRIQTDPDGYSTMILVRDGQGQVTGGGQTFDINPGQSYSFSGGDELSYDVQPAYGPDDFERWSEQRDLRENNSASARYVSPDMDGYYDLDDNGDWQNDPEYGSVWIPRNVAQGWAPYHDGHWVWIAPWGWTWVDAQPWGFAPFHYGRWAQVRGGYWGWVPGPPAVRPVYAPALVAFVGGGPGFGTSIGFGGGFAGVAWFPLGPRDVFVPSYRTSPRYVENVNISNTRVVNVTQVNNVYNTYRVNNTTINNTTVNNVTVNKINYTYANNPAAVTAVSRETFVGARPVAASAVRVTPQQLQSVRVEQAAPLAPTRASFVSSTARATPASSAPRVAFAQTKVVARIAPPAPIAPRPGVAPVVARPIVSAGVAPKGDRPAARTNPAGAAVKATQPPPRPANPNGRPVNNAPVAAQPQPARPVTPAPAPVPAEKPNNQSRPAPVTPQPKPAPAAPEQPAERPAPRPAPRPVPPPPAKNPPPVNTRDQQRDNQGNDRQPAQPKPQPPPPAARTQQPAATPPPETPAEAKEKQKQAEKAQKEEEKKKNEKPPKDNPQQNR
ncbi:MAG TPA: DUF6600 domain-containing protein [Candidatus Acidoferrales bacterium]